MPNKHVRLIRQDGTVVAESLEQATNMVSRGVGLMGRAALPAGAGLLIHGCSSIHMFFMRFPIDAVFLDKGGRVVKAYEHLRPWIGLGVAWKADRVAELPAGTVRRLGLKRGDTLQVAA